MEATLTIEATRRGVDRVVVVFAEGDERSGFDLLARCAPGQMERCPFCGQPGLFHDPERGGELA